MTIGFESRLGVTDKKMSNNGTKLERLSDNKRSRRSS